MFELLNSFYSFLFFDVELKSAFPALLTQTLTRSENIYGEVKFVDNNVIMVNVDSIPQYVKSMSHTLPCHSLPTNHEETMRHALLQLPRAPY